MNKFWFYCYDDRPIKHPFMSVMFSVEASYDIYEKKLLNLKGDERAKEICNIYEELTNEFINKLKNIDIKFAPYEEWEIKPEDEEFVFAKDIPKIREELIKIGWKEQYIPFGP